MTRGPIDLDDGRARGWGTWSVAVVVAALVLLAFSPTMENGFVNWDDDLNLRDNPHLRTPGLAPLRWAWTTFHLGVYQPLAWWLFEAQHFFWGFDPRRYHQVSILFHAANAIVLVLLTISLLARCRPGEPWARAASAGLATALFAVHPLRVEAVAWASCQPYLPCALFAMLAVLAYLRADGADPGPRRVWLSGSLAMFVVALLFHASAASLPAVLMILDVYPLRRLGGRAGWTGPARGVWWEKVPFVLTSLVFAGLAMSARSRDAFSTDQLDAPARIAQACYGAWFYLFATAWPLDLVAVYPLPRAIDWRAAPFLPAILGTVGVSVALFVLRRRWPGWLAAWLAYGIILTPSSGLIRTSQQITADRYSYLSMMAWSIVIAGALQRMARTRRGAAGILAIGLAVLPILIVQTRAQCRTWRDSRTLWTHAIEGAGRSSSVAHYNLGHELLRSGHPRAAEAHYVAALRIDPDNGSVRHNLGVALSRQGRYDEAAAQHREALRLDPGFAPAHFNLGVILARQGKIGEAATHYEAAIRLDPDDAIDAHYNLALILSSQRRFAEAETQYAQILRLHPDFAAAHNNLGNDLARQGRLDEAEAQYVEALRLDPGHREARENLDRVHRRRAGAYPIPPD